MITGQTDCREKSSRKGPRGGVTIPFPEKLHDVLNHEEYADVISWQPHGRCFILHKPQEFLKHIMPKHFRQSKLTSFQRQLNLYGFCRITAGPDKGSYYHERFLRGKPSLCAGMIRVRVKGTGNRSSPNSDAPNFYSMPPLESDDEEDAVAAINTTNRTNKWHEKSIEYKSSCSDSSLRGRSSVVSVTSSASFGSSDSDAQTSTDHEYPSPPASRVLQPRERISKMNTSRSPKLVGVSISIPVSPPFQSQVSNSDMESLTLGQSDHIPVQDELVMFEGKSFHYIESRCFQEKKELPYEGRRRSITFDEDSIFSNANRFLLNGDRSAYTEPEREDFASSNDISSESLMNIQSLLPVI